MVDLSSFEQALGVILLQRRLQLGLSREQAVEQLRRPITAATLADIEAGTRKLHRERLIELARVYQVPSPSVLLATALHAASLKPADPAGEQLR